MEAFSGILTFLLFIVSLAILITIHELGHFSMAKLFKVYCHEFSIGFGPIIYRKKRANQETAFSIRAIPFGGYVSMLGEETDAEEAGFPANLPPERSLEGIAKWKKAIVVAAGVILNAVLALILVFASNMMPYVTASNVAEVKENSIAYNAGIQNGDYLSFLGPDVNDNKEHRAFTFTYEDETGTLNAVQAYLVCDDIQIGSNHYAMTFFPQGNKNATNLSSALSLFVASESAKSEPWFQDWNNYNYSTPSGLFPDFRKPYILNTEVSFDATLTFKRRIDAEHIETILLQTTISITADNNYKIPDLGIDFPTRVVDIPFGTRMQNTFIDFGNNATAVFEGLGMLFSEGIKNMSGVVGIYTYSAEIFQQYTIATYLNFWSLISINLAIFNLLPFPGLDGFALLITVIEGVSRKKVPDKFKSVMSLIGTVLLFILMIVIVVMDVVKLI